MLIKSYQRTLKSKFFVNIFLLVAKKELKDTRSTIASVWQNTRIFVLGHDLFLETNSFPQASLSETCSRLRADNFRGQIYLPIFLCQIETIVYLSHT